MGERKGTRVRAVEQRAEADGARDVARSVVARRSLARCWAGKQGWRDGATDGGDADNRYTLRPAGYGPEARDAGPEVPATDYWRRNAGGSSLIYMPERFS